MQLVLEILFFFVAEKVHSIGVSNYEVRHLVEMEGYATRKPAVNQAEFHPHFRRADIREYCASNGIYFQVEGW